MSVESAYDSGIASYIWLSQRKKTCPLLHMLGLKRSY